MNNIQSGKSLKTLAPIAGVAIALIGSTAIAAPVCQWQSPFHPMLVAELFTSEGCSSCPPAERWLSTTLKTGNLTDRVLPLAFHVDYWDYIGWKDPYASADYSARQYQWQKAGASQIVYTPEFIVSGREYRGWRNPATLRQMLSENANQKAPVTIQATVLKGQADRLSIQIEQEWQGQAPAGTQTTVFLYEDGLNQQVDSGENRGETLRHDAVVRAMLSAPKKPSGGATAQMNFPLQRDWVRHKLGLGIVVSGNQGQRIFQALNVPGLLAQCTEQPQN